jgi:hypothetical protein
MTHPPTSLASGLSELIAKPTSEKLVLLTADEALCGAPAYQTTSLVALRSCGCERLAGKIIKGSFYLDSRLEPGP